MYSCEIWANADPFCARADTCIRNWLDIHTCIRNVLDIHTTYWELYYYVVNILISCGRCMAVKVGQMPIHFCASANPSSEIGRTSTLVSEICWTSMLHIWDHTTMLPIY